MTIAISDLISALHGQFTQDTRLLRLTTPIGANLLLAECVKGTEGISEGFRFELTALSTDAHIALKTLLGQPALLQLLTAASRTDLRPFHGHITAADMVGANGGLARYRLVIEPWTAFLALRRDSTTYQDMRVFEILESVFANYQGQGTLHPAWRIDIADPSIYPKRSLTTQYQESDLAFVSRLLLEEGLFTWFEHTGDAGSPSLGSHTLVIADHNGAFTPNRQADIDFTQPGAVMKHDSLDRWRSVRRWQTNALEVHSWDYRTLDVRTVAAVSNADNSADGMPLTSQDAPGVYAYEDRRQGQRIVDNQLQAVEAANKIFTGAGTVRTLAPATTFTLHGHAEHDREAGDDGRTFVIVRTVHLMHNNLSAKLQADVAQCLGQSALAADDDAQRDDVRHASCGDQSRRPLYRNRIDAIRSSIAYRSMSTDAQGRLLHPKPTVSGQQTAIVVGPAGAVIHTDRDHRIKVQFHWQRGNRSHSRLSHPHADGHTGAPADDSAGTWVRVATPLAPIAGANWGSVAIPRIGQEVLVDFIEGDIDRPVVIGSLYNGKGKPDAQYNDVTQGSGAATGNASAWFPGEQDGHAHPAVLSGIKTQAMSASQNGAGAYNQLVFDDSNEQSRIGLQHHANPHQGTAELNLGALRHQSDNQRLDKTGFGAELKTEHSAALRAGQGLLLSSDRRGNATSTQLDSREAQAQIEQSHQLQVALATTAQTHLARLKDEPAPEKLPAIDALAHAIDVVKNIDEGTSADNNGGGQGKVTAYSEPQLQLSSPAGIVATTPADAILVAGHSSSITAGHDINFASQGNSYHAVKAGISLFTYGKASNVDKPNQETGIKLHAASGKLISQSQSGETRITADKTVTVASITKSIKIAAPEHVLMTAMGAFMKIEGGNIELHGPGTIAFKASLKELAGPQSVSPVLPTLPNGELTLSNMQRHAYAAQYQVLEGEHKLPNQPYLLTLPDGAQYFGETDHNGKTVKVGSKEPKDVYITLLTKNDWDQENINVWHQEMDMHWD